MVGFHTPVGLLATLPWGAHHSRRVLLILLVGEQLGSHVPPLWADRNWKSQVASVLRWPRAPVSAPIFHSESFLGPQRRVLA